MIYPSGAEEAPMEEMIGIVGGAILALIALRHQLSKK